MLSFVVLLRVSILSGDFCLKQGIFLNSFVIANGLNKKEFRYLLLSYTGYGFGLNVLNRISKIVILS